MSVGKFTSLEEVRRDPKLLKQFVRERIDAGYSEGDQKKLEDTLASFLKELPAAERISSELSGEDCTGTQTPPDTSPDASSKR